MFKIIIHERRLIIFLFFFFFTTTTTGGHVLVPGRIPVGRHGTGHGGERHDGAQTGRHFLRAHNRVRRAPGVHLGRIVHVRLHRALRPFVRRRRRVGRHIAQAAKQVSDNNNNNLPS